MKLGTTVVKNNKKGRNFTGATTSKKKGAYGPANAPAMGANGSKTQGVIATGGYGAEGNVAGGNGAPAGGSAVVSSVDGGKMFREFLESVRTSSNETTISSIMEAYQALYNN